MRWQQVWRPYGCHLEHALHDVEGHITPLRQRPLLCCLAGLLGGSGLGTWVPLSPQLIGLIVVTLALVMRRWAYPQLQTCCRLHSHTFRRRAKLMPKQQFERDYLM